MALMDPASLDAALAEWAGRHLGFDRRALRIERLRLVAAGEAQRLGWPAFERALAEGEAGVDAALVAAATVGETYFFRQREHFDLLGELPFNGSEAAPLRAWSAGCATGEEAYSLAVALRQQKGLEAPALEVWGTDINEAALASARTPAYGRWSFRASLLEAPSAGSGQVPLDVAAETARTELIRQQVMDPKTLACVRFARQNLLDAPGFDGGDGPRFHAIFCRNVLVYFQPEAAEKALKHLVNALLPGGWLVLGNMDVTRVPAGTRRVGTAQLCVFERAAGRGAPLPRPSGAPLTLPLPLRPAHTLTLPPPETAPEAAAEDLAQAIDWHRGILAQLEAGEEAMALLELQALLEAFPTYLPGWFEHGLTLNRSGQRELAAQSLRKTLALAQALDPQQAVPGPEPLSLEFYVSNAEAFLQSRGDGA